MGARMRRVRFEPEVQAEIDKLGDRVTIRMGSKHVKVYVDGIFATICPATPRGTGRAAVLNIRASIRQAAQGRTPRNGRWITDS